MHRQRAGADVPAGLAAAIEDLADVPNGASGVMNVIALDACGGHGAVSTSAGRRYAVWEEGAEPTLADRLHVIVPGTSTGGS